MGYASAVEHFQRLNEWLQQDGSATRYQFDMLTPRGYGIFFTKLREGDLAGFQVGAGRGNNESHGGRIEIPLL
jgi:hypothetical protein